MQIKVIDGSGKVMFSSVSLGDFFIIDSLLYIKTNEQEGLYNAILCIEPYNKVSLKNDDIIIPIRSVEIKIK